MKRIIPFILFMAPAWGDAQSFFAIRQERKLILTAGTGTATYYGELSNPGTIINLQPNINVGLQAYVSRRISIRSELNWFILHGDDNLSNNVGRKLRGLSFRSNCFELSATGEINLFANGNRYYRRSPLNFYGFTGIGLLYFNPVGDYKGKAYSLEPLHTEGVGYSRVVPVIPIGFGMRIKVTPNLNIAIEGGYRKTFTDYLDDVSNKYVAQSTDPATAYFQNPKQAENNFQPGHKRGNPNSMDSYFLLNAKIEYYLPFSASNRRRGNGLIKRKSNYLYNKNGGLRRRR